ncbi:MAG: helix-turn-helix transcriptional regulator [Burkholderiaceae bacterium]|jgi:transcriptional regulator with XRE-family HTH domain|nr:helix-turn-helix transcriptional regulator [Burkholderiaceae bacterium]
MNAYRRRPKSFESWTIGQRLEWLLHRRKLTQTDAAKLIGISQATIANIVGSAARQPSSQTLLKMARALDCSPSFILDGTGSLYNYEQANDDEQAELLTLYKGLDSTHQTMLLVFARMLAGKPTHEPSSRRSPHIASDAID